MLDLREIRKKDSRPKKYHHQSLKFITLRSPISSPLVLNFIIESISGSTVNLTEPVPGQSIGSTIEFFVEIELEDEQESDEPAPM